jgi:hypothetical protein
MKDITILLPTSPIPSHPSTEVIEETIANLRERLPDSEIILMFDGISPTLQHLKTDYDKYTQHMLWKTNLEYKNITPLFFDHHMHQSLMTREALKIVRTPMILFSEQDTPLHNDIPFDTIGEAVRSGYANLVRFHHEATIPADHEYLMLDKEPIEILGAKYIRTRQWSQRPHLASTKYYREICDKYWDDQPRFIEHIMYGLVAEGGDNYDEHRLHIYAPDGTLVRHKHVDGRRKGAEHYDPTAS